MEKKFETQKRQLPSLEGTAKKKKDECCSTESSFPMAVSPPVRVPVPARRLERPTPTKSMKFMGGDYLWGFKPDPNYNFEARNLPDFIPKGALPEHRPHFSDIWSRYTHQAQSTNGMDIDTFPGCSMTVDVYPVKFSTNAYEDAVMLELVNLALEIYNNDESNVFKYKFLKIDKANVCLTGYLEFFMTVKFLNVTLGTVIETFQIYAGQTCGRPHQEVFSCVPKAGALLCLPKLDDGEGKEDTV